MIEKYVMLAAVGIATYYPAFHLNEPVSFSRSIVKTIPVALLAIVALLSGAAWPLWVALLLCSLGDYLLSREGEAYFTSGLVAFLVGHLVYIWLFISIGNVPIAEGMSTKTGMYTALLTYALAILVVVRLWPHTGSMRLPVNVYALVITTMAVVASSTGMNRIVLAGALLFIVSDILIAYEKFVPLRSKAFVKALPFLIWVLYFSGQALIVYGVLWV